MQLFRFAGIRVGADWTWLLVLGYLIVVLSGDYKTMLGDQREIEAFGFATGVALSFFGSLILHEFGHAIVARRNGIGIQGIDLWMLGGVARMDRETPSPGVDFRVAIAGPLVTLFACIGLGALAFGVDPASAERALRFESVRGEDPWVASLVWLSAVNAILLIFNLIPAFPLDGGRMARAIAWKLTGSRERGTVGAASLGRLFGYMLMGLGLWLALSGALVQGIFISFMGVFLSQAARGAVVESRFVAPISALTVADVMDPEPVAIPGEFSVRRALDEFFWRYRWPWFPVVDASGRLLGLLDRAEVDAVADDDQEIRKVIELLTGSENANDLSVGEEEPLTTLLDNPTMRKYGAIPAVDDEGKLLGVVTPGRIRRVLRETVAPVHQTPM